MSVFHPLQTLAKWREWADDARTGSPFAGPARPSIASVRGGLAQFPWDWEEPPLATLNGPAVASILRRYEKGELTAEQVETWANLVEVRDDIEFDGSAGRHFYLANPLLMGLSRRSSDLWSGCTNVAFKTIADISLGRVDTCDVRLSRLRMDMEHGSAVVVAGHKPVHPNGGRLWAVIPLLCQSCRRC